MDLWELVRDIAMATITVMVFFWGRDRKQTADAIDERFKAVARDVEADLELRDMKIEEVRRSVEQLIRTIDRANEKSSEMTGYVQQVIGRLDRMPEELRNKFMSLERGMDLMNEARQDRKALWEIVDRLAQGPKRPNELRGRND